MIRKRDWSVTPGTYLYSLVEDSRPGNTNQGVGEQINLVPMPKSVNSGGGDWYKMEEAWAAYLNTVGGNNQITTLIISINYSWSSKKPQSFEVKWLQYDDDKDKFILYTNLINNY